MILSSQEDLHNGILLIRSASWGLNNPCKRLKFHCLESGSMRSDTLASSKPSTIGDRILGCSKDGNHESSQTPIDSPLPTLLPDTF